MGVIKDNELIKLAKEYSIKSNYIIIYPVDTLEELEDLWSKFNSIMTIKQQRLSDDRCIQLFNMTNLQHYEYIKSQLTEKESKHKPIQTSENDKIHASDIKSIDIETGIDKDIEDDKISFDSFYENTDDLKADLTNKAKADMAEKYQNDSNINMIDGKVKNSSSIESDMAELDKQYQNYLDQPHDIKKKADDECRLLYGCSNMERYNKLKSSILSSIDSEIKNGFVGERFKLYTENKMKEESCKKKRVSRRLSDTPYFSPPEMIDLGVHGNNNYYSDTPDNNGLIKNVTVTNWFDNYKDQVSGHISENYTSAWIDKLYELYSDYEEIKESGDIDRINARKQSILDLGWNPELEFSSKNRIEATRRINEYIEHCIPVDEFINIDSIIEEDCSIPIDEAVSIDHKPVFLILTKGKTPIISDSIKKITHSEYSHASISLDPELNEISSYNMRKESFGFITEKLSSFKDNTISVFAFFVDNKVFTALRNAIYDFKTHDTTYDFRILFRKLFHIDIKPGKDEYNQVCSTFVDSVLKHSGVNLVGDIRLATPADLYEGIKNRSNRIYEIYTGPANMYNGKKNVNAIEKLRRMSYTTTINENAILNEVVRKFPVEFDSDGNLTIYKYNTNRLDYEEEIEKSVTILETYRNTNDEEGLKYELAKLWFLIDNIEKEMKKKNIKPDKYNDYVTKRSIMINMFKTNFKYLTKIDKDFNFATYYNSTPFADNGVKITNHTIRYSMENIKNLFR